jgi:hypothetical protein
MAFSKPMKVGGQILWTPSKMAFSRLDLVVPPEGDQPPFDAMDLYWRDKWTDRCPFSQFPPGLILNRMPGLSEICRNPRFFRRLRSAAQACPDVCFPEFIPDFVSFSPRHPENPRFPGPWIAKHADDGKSRLLKFVFEDCCRLDRKALVQSYVRPLLLPAVFPGHKWDFRFYLLLMKGIHGEEFSVYFYDDGLVSSCETPYSEPSADNLSPSSHFAEWGQRSGPERRIWSLVFSAVYDKIRAVQLIPREPGEAVDPRENEVMNRLKEIALFTALAIWPWIKQCTAQQRLEGRRYFHITAIDLIFDADGNPQVLGLNDRPTLLRRPADRNEEQNVSLIEEAVRLVLRLPIAEQHWERLYPLREGVRPPWHREVVATKLRPRKVG